MLQLDVYNFQETMSKSPTSPKHETNGCSCCEFDPRVNFSQFLEEARQHARDINLRRSSSYSETRLGAEKKSKKSWRNSLFSWCKIDRKSKFRSDPIHVSNKHYGSCGTTKGIETPHRCPLSGPVSVLFTPARKMENEVSYMSLDQSNNPDHVNSYGPVYLVT
ncbi:uncharacterized protein LOC120205930 [Hibiscus syriacus]|uniref:uncharacterized protein LOC120205930 n=1 Tax=Hibiscus syriacus TaxID=106335 RepID=UPI0019222384|nr:uncharacterized protein LOC120205930 [Hibiscus syriacus]